MIKKNTNIIALIPAKKNSRGLKNKNLKKLNKLSLVELAILGAKKSKLINKIYLSSDSDKILDIGVKLNIDVIKNFFSTVGQRIIHS
jgi:CMP-N-acetylneuraminic acid synthetase